MDHSHVYRIGVDPAWKNLGVSVIKEEVKTGKLTPVFTKVMNPSTYKSISEFVSDLHDEVHHSLVHEEDHADKSHDQTVSVTIERFVAYAGVSTSETENICMIIGALQFMFYSDWGLDALMLRAIDWKTTLVKELYKQKGFDNPSAKLDKKFSIAAGVACLDVEVKFKTDHEADATCLAAYPSIVAKGKKK